MKSNPYNPTKETTIEETRGSPLVLTLRPASPNWRFRPFLVIFLPTMFSSFTKLRVRRSFWGANWFKMQKKKCKKKKYFFKKKNINKKFGIRINYVHLVDNFKIFYNKSGLRKSQLVQKVMTQSLVGAVTSRRWFSRLLSFTHLNSTPNRVWKNMLTKIIISDDPLMVEIANEFTVNPLLFKQKAKQWTEEYAKYWLTKPLHLLLFNITTLTWYL